MIGIFALETPNEVMTPAKAAAERALMLDGSLSEVHTVLAEVQKLYEWDWAAAERSYLRAIQLDENYAVAHHWYAQLLSIVGRHDESQSQIEMARRCDPVSPTIAAFVSHLPSKHAGSVPFIEACLGYVYARAGDRSRAEQILARLRTRALTGYVSPIDLAQIHLGLHDCDAAMAQLDEAYRTRVLRTVIIGDPFFPDSYRTLGTGT
jgi:tetratricopeptide (TPR) repeat protein